MKRIRTGRASRLGRRIRCAFCLAFCVVFCVVFTVWRIVGRGENPVGPGTSVPGGVRVFKLSWPSTAEYRMMKLKKKNCMVKQKTKSFESHPQPLFRHHSLDRLHAK